MRAPLIRFVTNHAVINRLLRFLECRALLRLHVPFFRNGVANKVLRHLPTAQGCPQSRMRLFLPILHARESVHDRNLDVVDFFPCDTGKSGVCYQLMRAYDYGRKRITPVQQKRWERMKIFLILAIGGIILGVLFYLIATK